MVILPATSLAGVVGGANGACGLLGFDEWRSSDASRISVIVVICLDNRISCGIAVMEVCTQVTCSRKC